MFYLGVVNKLARVREEHITVIQATKFLTFGFCTCLRDLEMCTNLASLEKNILL